jgi:hypothetical protein
MTGSNGWNDFGDWNPTPDDDDVEECRVLWESTRNSAYVWRAIHICPLSNRFVMLRRPSTGEAHHNWRPLED